MRQFINQAKKRNYLYQRGPREFNLQAGVELISENLRQLAELRDEYAIKSPGTRLGEMDAESLRAHRSFLNQLCASLEQATESPISQLFESLHQIEAFEKSIKKYSKLATLIRNIKGNAILALLWINIDTPEQVIELIRNLAIYCTSNPDSDKRDLSDVENNLTARVKQSSFSLQDYVATSALINITGLSTRAVDKLSELNRKIKDILLEKQETAELLNSIQIADLGVLENETNKTAHLLAQKKASLQEIKVALNNAIKTKKDLDPKFKALEEEVVCLEKSITAGVSMFAGYRATIEAEYHEKKRLLNRLEFDQLLQIASLPETDLSLFDFLSNQHSYLRELQEKLAHLDEAKASESLEDRAAIEAEYKYTKRLLSEAQFAINLKIAVRSGDREKLEEIKQEPYLIELQKEKHKLEAKISTTGQTYYDADDSGVKLIEEEWADGPVVTLTEKELAEAVAELSRVNQLLENAQFEIALYIAACENQDLKEVVQPSYLQELRDVIEVLGIDKENAQHWVELGDGSPAQYLPDQETRDAAEKEYLRLQEWLTEIEFEFTIKIANVSRNKAHWEEARQHPYLTQLRTKIASLETTRTYRDAQGLRALLSGWEFEINLGQDNDFGVRLREAVITIEKLRKQATDWESIEVSPLESRKIQYNKLRKKWNELSQLLNYVEGYGHVLGYVEDYPKVMEEALSFHNQVNELRKCLGLEPVKIPLELAKEELLATAPEAEEVLPLEEEAATKLRCSRFG